MANILSATTRPGRFFWLILVAFMGVGGGHLAAESFFVMEAHSGRVLVAQNATAKVPVASLTKIATAIVVMDWAQVTGTDLGTLAIVPHSGAELGGANPMGLMPGNRIPLRNALYSALMGSDNVAAQTMAHHVGFAMQRQRGQTGDPVKEFVEEMNVLANALGMSRTKFANPSGVDTARERGVSTAADMARLCVYAMKHPGFAFFVKQKSRRVSFYRGSQELAFTVANTNHLLGQMDINGIKTGYTQLAGQCLATSSERKPIVQKLADGRSRMTEQRLICVVLGSADRFARTRGLVTDGWGRYDQWRASGSPVQDAAKEMIVVPAPR
ncbi:MAG: serine hydrolase [Verrucomicrobia bacterium]|nr:serine hydrolase [Verrucomicrobiota bacterium]MDA1006380.1 serine hydrolase [Verrucomicrobiota bacterium]